MKRTNNKSDDFISLISIILVLLIIFYIFYSLYKSNKSIDINKIDEITNEIEEKIVPDTDTKNDDKKNKTKPEKVIIEQELSSYTSTIYDDDENRVFNITKACETLNGTVINPGEEFSFNSTIGPMDEEHGYTLATGFDSNGKLIDIPGGGMCQISSTLYNAALLSNLEITERHAHSRRVNYVPENKDAAIFYPDVDLKFINSTNNPITIYASTDGYSICITLKSI